MAKSKDRAAEAERQLSRPQAINETLDPATALSSGSTLLNMALTGTANGAFYPGKYYLFVGDSGAGKTMLTLTCFAEAARNPRFKNYRFIHDNAEDGALMDVERFFGKACSDRIEPPSGSQDNPVFSSTVEELYYNIDNAFNRKTPFIYVVDSMDSLDTEDDQDKFDERKQAHEAGKEAKGSYGMSKAKLNSGGLRRVFGRLKKSQSIIVFISQTRDNTDPLTSRFNKRTRSGGKALKFFCHAEMWATIAGAVEGRARSKVRKLGVYAKVAVKKNRQTGRDVEVEVPILWSIGIDDTGSCVDYLVEEKHWKKLKGETIQTEEFGTMTREELIESIEEGGHVDRLKRMVASVWREVQREMTPVRKSRYSDD